jgi:hypothetical protein
VRILRDQKLPGAIFLVLLLIFIGNFAYGSNTTSGTINVCINKKTGVLRSANVCQKTERPLMWNLVGPKGATILSGPTLPNDSNKPDAESKIGDYFLVTSTATLYGPKTDKGWPTEGVRLQGPSGSGGRDGRDGFIPLFASFYSDQIQSITTINTAKAVTLSANGSNGSGITLVDGSKITFSKAGTYNLAFSLQLYNPNPSSKTDAAIDIWLSKMGTAVPATNTQMTLVKALTKHAAAWNFFVTVNANEYVQLVWAADDLDSKIYAGDGLPGSPSIPSVILTVNQVG